MKIIKMLNILILIIINIYNLYFLLTSSFYFIKNKKINKKSNKQNNFTILIPARNEEMVIANLINSLNKQNYNKNKYNIYVVINNTTDNTEKEAKKYGANIINCKNKINNKGDALKEAFDTLKDEKTDAYIILDADNIVNKQFLYEMNKSLNSGYKAAKSKMDIKGNEKNWVSNSYAIYFYIQNILFNEARNNIGLSSAVNGTGLMIKKQIIDKYGFEVKTITEDIEFMAICSLNDIKIDYVKKAICYTEHPSNFKVSYIQRKRWTKGIYSGFKIYATNLTKHFFKNGNIPSLDILLIYSLPIIQLLAIISMILTFIINIMNLKNLIYFSLIGILLVYICSIFIALFVVLSSKKDIKTFISGILLFPIFILSWLPIYLIVLFDKDVKWEEIKHVENIEIDNAF